MPELYTRASPVDRVCGEEPPCLFLHGDADATVPLQQSRDLHGRLVAAGVTSELVVLPGVKHGFGYGVESPAQKRALAESERFLQEQFSL